MKATEFGRNDCKLGKQRISYDALVRAYRCNVCDGRLTLKWSSKGWHVACARCGSMDFVHENEIARQTHEAAEALDGLPPELAALIDGGAQ